jgi:hypothetical protein
VFADKVFLCLKPQTRKAYITCLLTEFAIYAASGLPTLKTIFSQSVYFQNLSPVIFRQDYLHVDNVTIAYPRMKNYLGFFVASGMAYERRAGFRIWTEKIRPDLQGKRRGLRNFLKSLTKIVPVISKSGGFLGQAGILEVQRQPIQRVLYKIAKGLYFLDTNQVLQDDVEILADYFDKPEGLGLPPLDEAIKGAEKFAYGNGVVTYWRNIVKDDPTASLTWLLFYEDKAFLICTFRKETLEAVNEAS